MVTKRTAGLRFDIFERIELPQEVASINQLEDIELTPQIQLFADEEQAILRGNLLLTGAYEGHDLRGGHRLEHTIPVEISLPMHRVSNVDDIGVEIENFDVDVLSDRKLSVTGVLSLNGVDVQNREVYANINAIDEGVAAEGAREIERADTAEQLQGVRIQGEQTQAEQVEVERVEAERVEAERVEVEQNRGEQAEAGQADSEQTLGGQADAGQVNFEQEQANYVEMTRSPLEESGFEFASNEQSEELVDQENALQEAVKIAFSSQRSTDQNGLQSSQIVTNAQHAEAVEQGSDVVNDGEVNASDTRASEADGELGSDEEVDSRATSETDWKNFLLARDNEADQSPQFKKMKMCIIQKEETLSTIAERYSINPRELILYNRLGEQEVEEGQVIYIPV